MVWFLRTFCCVFHLTVSLQRCIWNRIFFSAENFYVFKRILPHCRDSSCHLSTTGVDDKYDSPSKDLLWRLRTTTFKYEKCSALMRTLRSHYDFWPPSGRRSPCFSYSLELQILMLSVFVCIDVYLRRHTNFSVCIFTLKEACVRFCGRNLLRTVIVLLLIILRPLQ